MTNQITYRGYFEVQGGASPGFGVKYPDETTYQEDFVASNETEAFRKALTHARRLSMDHLSDPNTNKTIVTMTLTRPDGGEVDQREVFRRLYKGDKPLELEEAILREFPEGNAVVVATQLDHLMASSL
ncbi:MAG: hypothetical protein IIA87_04195 [Nanoarchaeota archaeon]|nr:hypothetical protein [Nanoarchaeota archaeon]